MNDRTRLFLMFVLICALLLNACGTPLLTEPEIPGLVNTLAVQTIAAITQEANQFAPVATMTATEIASAVIDVSSGPSPTPLFADQSKPASPMPSLPADFLSSTSTPLPTLGADQSGGNYASYDGAANGGSEMVIRVVDSSFVPGPDTPCNAAEFIADVTVPDEMIVKPNQKFTKVWSLRNIGSCAWNSEYALVLSWGEPMGTHPPVAFYQEIKPGETIEVGLNMVAPTMPNCYQGNWMLQDGQGNRFGIGSKYAGFFWVAITVWWPGTPLIFRG